MPRSRLSLRHFAARIGFVGSVAGACITCGLGLRAPVRDLEPPR